MKEDPRASRSRQVATAIVALLTAGLAACSDGAEPSISAPEHSVSQAGEQALAMARARSSTIPESFVAQGLLRDRPLHAALIVAKTISSEGGTIAIPAADFQLQIPRGAIATPLTITVTALPGAAVAYDFEPHGATFNTPLKFVQRLNHTRLGVDSESFDGEPGVTLAGFSERGMIDPTTGVGVAFDSVGSQTEPTGRGNLVSFMIWRFSGYMASTGRR